MKRSNVYASLGFRVRLGEIKTDWQRHFADTGHFVDRLGELMTSYRIFLLWIMVLVTLPSSAVQSAPVQVWIAAGQSNMVGAGRVEHLPDDIDSLIPEVIFNQDVGIVPSEGLGPLQPRLTTNGAIRRWYGPELSFGHAIRERPVQQVILKFARNGTSLANSWTPGSDLVAAFHEFIDDNLLSLSAMGYDPQVTGMLWVQGSGDANGLDQATEYASNLERFVGDIRQRYDANQMQLIYGQTHIDAARPYTDELRESQASYQLLDPNSVMISVDDLSLKSDDIHYTSETQIELGLRMAAVAIPEPLSAGAIIAIAIGVAVFRRNNRPL